MTDPNTPRRAVTKRLRFEVLRRDRFRCTYCGLPGPETGEGLVVDHVVPVALGGSDDPSNLVAACRDCNSGKSSATPDQETVAQVATDAARWAAALEQVAASRAQELHGQDGHVQAFDDEWADLRLGRVPDDGPRSIRQFGTLGLTIDDITHFVRVTHDRGIRDSAGRWLYFCKRCWNEIKERQRLAAELVAAPHAAERAFADGGPYNLWSDLGAVLALALHHHGDVAANLEHGIRERQEPSGGDQAADDFRCSFDAVAKKLVQEAAESNPDDLVESFYASCTGHAPICLSVVSVP